MNEYGVRVKLCKDFLVVKETLERIGIANKRKKVITPSCYILHKKGNYFIVHFKLLLAMDGFKKEINEQDINRQNAICTLLQNWGMIEIIDDDIYQEELKERIFVLSYNERISDKYTINHKFRMRS